VVALGVLMISTFQRFFSDATLWQSVAVAVISTLLLGVPVWAWWLVRHIRQKSVDQDRERLHVKLAGFRDRTKALRDRIRAHSPLWNDEAEVERLCRGLEEDAQAFLRADMPAAIALFDRDTTTRPERYQPGAPDYISSWGNWLERRLDAVDEIIRGL
jgi:hypothetical protein